MHFRIPATCFQLISRLRSQPTRGPHSLTLTRSRGPHVEKASVGGPAGLLKQLRSRGSDKDVHLVGDPNTVRAFYDLGALDRLELLVLPFMAGGGIPLSLPASDELRIRLVRSDRAYPDGTVELVYRPSTGEPQ